MDGGERKAPPFFYPRRYTVKRKATGGPRYILSLIHIYRYVPAAEQIIANYKEVAPHVTINYTNLPWSNWFEAYSTAVASNGAPDVATGGGYMPFRFATSDEAADLQWIVDQWEKEGTLEDFPEGFMEYYRFKDKQVGICFNVDPRGILVRKDWLEEKGLAEPTNWDEFLEMCKAFTDKEKGTYGFAYGVDVYKRQILTTSATCR